MSDSESDTGRSDTDRSDTDWIDWDALERAVPLDELPSLHRSFLAMAQPDEDWDGAFLRRVQGKVKASLKALERQGLAKTEDGTFWVARRMVPDAYLHHLEDEPDGGNG